MGRAWGPPLLTNCCQIVLYLLRRSYAHLYTLVVSSEAWLTIPHPLGNV